MRTRTKWMIAGATAIGLAGIAPAAFAATAPPAGWHVAPSPNPGGSAVLGGVTAATKSNFWAVGSSLAAGGSSGRPLILHQTGTGPWKVVDVPALHRAGGFNAVSAHGPGDIWAVGGLGTPALGTLTAHFDGHAWTVVPAPSVAGARLAAVSTLSPTNAWAVGTRQTPTGSATLVEHWNGTAWSVVPSPSPDAFSGLAGVVAIAPNDVWAVGHSGDEFVVPVVEHWTGTRGASSRYPYPRRTPSWSASRRSARSTRTTSGRSARAT